MKDINIHTLRCDTKHLMKHEPKYVKDILQVLDEYETQEAVITASESSICGLSRDIEELKAENEHYKSEYEKFFELYAKYRKENERLKKVLKELREWMEKNKWQDIMMVEGGECYPCNFLEADATLNKLTELEE